MASRLLKPVRRSAVAAAAAAATSVSFGQMLFLKASYASPPDAIGPRAGVESPEPMPGDTPPAQLPSVLVSSSAIHPQSTATTTAAEAAVEAAQAQEASGLVSVAGSMSDVEAIVANISQTAASNANENSNDSPRKKPRILVIGDSLVSGVGGESSWSDGSRSGPPLPRHIAHFLSQKWNADVQWNTMSLTGGDVRMLARKILPMLRRERVEREENGAGSDPLTAVVLVTGVNDWKRMSPFRTPSKFKRDLAEFIKSIRTEVGDQDCHVFLPAIPGVHHAPRFHYPLRSFLIFINDLWDAQKVALARAMRNVHFVGNPPEADWTTEPAKFFCTQDRLHPSELGYTRWGERIAAQIASATEKGRAALLNARLSGKLASTTASSSAAAAASASAMRASSVASG